METEIDIALKGDSSICLRKYMDDTYALSIHRSYSKHATTQGWADLERSELTVLRNALNRMLGD